jgi:MFS family permease
VAGSLAGAREGAIADLGTRYLGGLLLVAVGMLLSGLAPSYPVALATFALTGVGNGLVVVHERLLLQRMVPDSLRGRVFGVADGLASWAFGAAFLGAGVLASLAGTRVLFVVAGIGGIAVWAVTALALQRALEPVAPPPQAYDAALARP